LIKEEDFKAQIETIKKESRIRAEFAFEEKSHGLQTEIERLTTIVNTYKEKISRKERENTNLLAELHIWKAKVESVKRQYIQEINDLKVRV